MQRMDGSGSDISFMVRPEDEIDPVKMVYLGRKSSGVEARDRQADDSGKQRVR
jgi:hypothetical protein